MSDQVPSSVPDLMGIVENQAALTAMLTALRERTASQKPPFPMGALVEASVAPKTMVLAWRSFGSHLFLSRLASPGRWANAELTAKGKALVPRLRRSLDLPAVCLEKTPARVLSLRVGPREAARARTGRPKAFHFCCRADTKKILPWQGRKEAPRAALQCKALEGLERTPLQAAKLKTHPSQGSPEPAFMSPSLTCSLRRTCLCMRGTAAGG